jgi:putative nucleotidyltransferase with HDIG domain
MLKIKVSSLKPGVKLGKDIYSYDGQLLLPKGITVGQDELDAFARRGINEVFVMEASSRQKSEKKFADVYLNALEVTRSFMMGAKLEQELDYEEISSTVDMLVQQVFDQNDLFQQMRKMMGQDDYLFTHSVNVSILCILLGRWLKCDDKEIKELGIAGILHDIGKINIPDNILNKPDKLTADEYEQIKQHTLIGYNMVNQYDWINDSIANAVLMHHERADGSGYPIGLKGYKINLYASVVAVADVYDALTSSRSYSNKVSPYTAAEVLWQDSFGKLDPRISKVFYDKITNFYVGNEVVLSNQEVGLVVYVDPSQPTRPIVMVGDKFYNLSEERSITILEVID